MDSNEAIQIQDHPGAVCCSSSRTEAEEAREPTEAEPSEAKAWGSGEPR